MKSKVILPAMAGHRPARWAVRSRDDAAAALALLLVGTGLQGEIEATPPMVRPRADRASTASQRIKLGLNKSVVIDLPADAYDILVANPAVADAVTRTSRRIYLFGKAVGETNIFVFGPNGEQIVEPRSAG